MEGIYKITNKTNGKSYIGQSVHCGKRLDEHCKGRQFIDDIIQLECIENFTFEILKQVDKEDMSKWEDYYIEKYNTLFPNGYNRRWNTKEETRKEFIQSIKNQEEGINHLVFGIKNINDFISTNGTNELYTCLTTKQFRVYMFLFCLSITDDLTTGPRQIVKSNMVIKDCCSFLKIEQPTWRTSLKILKEKELIAEDKLYYYIEIPDVYSIINKRITKDLLFCEISKDLKGNIIKVYSLLYNYWKYCNYNGNDCVVTLNEIRGIFKSKTNADAYITYDTIVSILEDYRLITTERYERKDAHNHKSYLIKNIYI